MDYFSVWHWLIVGSVALVLFGGRGRISDIMGDVAKGIKAFKKGIADTSESKPPIDRPRTTVSPEAAGSDSERPQSASET